MGIRFYQVDSFATRALEGNPAGVVPDARGLDETTMRRVAREINASETAFVLEKPGDGYDVEIRFFTPTREVPVCGHATVAAHYVRALERGYRGGVVRMRTKAGILPVEVLPEGDDLRVVMTQGAIEFGPVLEGDDRTALLAGLGVGPADLEPGLPIRIVSTSHGKVMVPLASRARLDALEPDDSALAALSGRIGCNGFYAFSLDSGEPGVLASGRMFAPAIGIREDPVTGNANGPLGAYLTRYGRIPALADGYSFRIKQGEAMDRKGYMDVAVFCEDGEPVRVTIGGRAHVAFEATLS